MFYSLNHIQIWLVSSQPSYGGTSSWYERDIPGETGFVIITKTEKITELRKFATWFLSHDWYWADEKNNKNNNKTKQTNKKNKKIMVNTLKSLWPLNNPMMTSIIPIVRDLIWKISKLHLWHVQWPLSNSSEVLSLEIFLWILQWIKQNMSRIMMQKNLN